MTSGEKISWMPLISKHLAGQGLVNITNILVGLILLRILSVEEFALYTLSMIFLQVAALGSDMGLSQAINSMGAKIRQARQLLGSLYSSACYYGQRLYVASATVVSVLFLLILFDHDWSPINALASLFLLLLIVATQITVNFRKSVLNIHHDANGLFQTGMVEAGTRLLLIPVCLTWPYAAVAIFTSLVGACASRLVAIHHCRSKMEEKQPAASRQKEDLGTFISPLIPVNIYHSLQGQLSVFMLGIYGYTASIAQVGALGRLGQLISIPMLINGFLIQPTFSRIKQKQEFIKKATLVFAAIIGFSGISMASVIVVPHWWLFILGGNYQNLINELPVAVMTALFTLLGATLYTMVISRNTTRGQFWYIATGLLGQFIFIATYGVHSTLDALVLGLVPVIGYAFVQAALLWIALCQWKET